MNNQVATKPTFTMTINSTGYKNLINKTLGDPKRASRFIASITSAVVTNPALQDCDAQSIVSAGFLGESLNLSPSPQLGQYYLVPFNDNKRGKKVAQFQIGYKGYIQLALRSGEYKDIDVMDIREGEYLGRDKRTGKRIFEFTEDEDIREEKPVIGYMAYFEYLNGFTKVLYWSKAKMEKHALEYSKGYAAKKGYTFWEKNFDDMAFKTMIRQLLSKWGILSTEMQEAFENDNAIVNEDGSTSFVETEDKIIEQAEPVNESSEAPKDVTEVVDMNEL